MEMFAQATCLLLSRGKANLKSPHERVHLWRSNNDINPLRLDGKRQERRARQNSLQSYAERERERERERGAHCAHTHITYTRGRRNRKVETRAALSAVARSSLINLSTPEADAATTYQPNGNSSGRWPHTVHRCISSGAVSHPAAISLAARERRS